MPCIVVRTYLDGAVYAHRVPRDVNVASAVELEVLAADCLADWQFEIGEEYDLGVADTNDPGLARLLLSDVKVEWFDGTYTRAEP